VFVVRAQPQPVPGLGFDGRGQDVRGGAQGRGHHLHPGGPGDGDEFFQHPGQAGVAAGRGNSQGAFVHDDDDGRDLRGDGELVVVHGVHQFSVGALTAFGDDDGRAQQQLGLFHGRGDPVDDRLDDLAAQPRA
jgi:hypothetical protein